MKTRSLPSSLGLTSASLFASALLLGAAEGEGTGKVSVTVRDNWGVISGATVRLTNETTKASTRAVTDRSGAAVFATLPTGTYGLKVEFSGFADYVKAGIALAGGEQKSLEAQLSLPQFSTSVTVTTANRREELLLNVASPTTVIESTQIDDTGGRSAKDVLVEQTGSGVQVQAGGGQGYVSINGIPNSGVLVLIDGRRYLGKDANGNFDLDNIQLAGIERIEIVKGAGSALYGADALGGVINFITKKGTDPGFTNRLDLTGGSYTDLRGYDTLGWRGSRGGFTLGGGYRTYDGFDLDKTNPQTIGQPESKYKNASVSGDVQISDRLVGRLFGDFQRRNIDNYFFSGATQLASTVYNSQRELTRYTLSPELEVLPTADSSIHLTYNYGKYLRDETRIFVVGGRVSPQAPWREWNHELKLTGRYTWKASDQANPLQGGYEFRREKLERGTLSATNPNRDINVFWAQQEINLGAKLKVTGGFRYDDYSDFGNQWSPKASAVFTPAESHRIRTSYGHGFRAPYFGELYLFTPPFFVGNPDLKPEKSDTVTAGYAYAGPRAQVSADYFRAEVKDGITFDLSGFPFTYGNLSHYTSQGVNVAVSVNLPSGFVPSVSYTYDQRKDDSGVEIGGYPKHSAFLKLLWTNPRLGLRANVRGQVLGKTPPSIEDGTYQPAYNVWYAQVSKKIAIRDGHAVSLFVQVDNIFDEKDVFLFDNTGHPIQGDFQVWLAPRTFLVGITLDMDWTR